MVPWLLMQGRCAWSVLMSLGSSDSGVLDLSHWCVFCGNFAAALSLLDGQFSSLVLLVFHRKDLCEAKHEMQSVFKFSDVLFAL